MTTSLQDIAPGLHIRQYRQARFDQIISPFPAVIRVEAGEKRVSVGSETCRAQAGYLVLLPEHTDLTVENLPEPDQAYAATALAFRRAVFEAAYARLEDVQLARADAVPACPSQTDIQAAFDATQHAFTHGAPASRKDILCERLALELALAGTCLPPPKVSGFGDALRECLASDLSRAWTAQAAARALGTSPATLRRKLRAEGTAFNTILRELRLASGLHLIQTTRWPIASVAGAVGYVSPSRFSQRFRDRFGMAPGDLRKPVPTRLDRSSK